MYMKCKYERFVYNKIINDDQSKKHFYNYKMNSQLNL